VALTHPEWARFTAMAAARGSHSTTSIVEPPRPVASTARVQPRISSACRIFTASLAQVAGAATARKE
jgi:hypothetical protein